MASKDYLKIGSYMDIFPIHGRLKSIRLNRTVYNIYSSNLKFIEIDSNNIYLPSFCNEYFEIQLSTINRSDIDSIFLLELKKGNPFKINGNYVYKALVSRDDIIDIEYNKIRFNDNNEIISQEQKNLLPYKKVFKSSINILLEGETGTGKSRLAKIIHKESARTGRFIHVNLSAFSPSLIESELFGHIKGSFTGALSNKRGAFLLSNGGTLFLDEIDSLSSEIQTKLLLFLDDNKIRPVGSEDEVKCDTRIIFASGRNLDDLVDENLIRRDFFYRIISGERIKLRPLRNNPVLLEELLNNFCFQHDVTFSNGLVKFYKTLNWYGNIRQFLGHLERKRILSVNRKLYYDDIDKKLLVNDFPVESNENFFSLKELRNKYAYHVFNYFDRELLKSSKVLKISKATMRNLINEIENGVDN